jgi:hypothetical protein
VSVEQDDRDRLTPQTVVRFTRDWKGPGPAEVAGILRQGNPPIYVGTRPAEQELYVNTHMLRDDEPDVIGKRLQEVLTRE